MIDFGVARALHELQQRDFVELAIDVHLVDDAARKIEVGCGDNPSRTSRIDARQNLFDFVPMVAAAPASTASRERSRAPSPATAAADAGANRASVQAVSVSVSSASACFTRRDIPSSEKRASGLDASLRCTCRSPRSIRTSVTGSSSVRRPEIASRWACPLVLAISTRSADRQSGRSSREPDRRPRSRPPGQESGSPRPGHSRSEQDVRSVPRGRASPSASRDDR